MRGLKDKAAIVTGGSSGIGRACVERLCEEGCSVTFSGVSDIGDTTVKELSDKGFSVQFLRGDMAEESFCKELVATAAGQWGRLDYLVNNAFSFTATGLNATREEWDRVMHVGPVAYATMGQLAFPHMQKQGAGAIVLMSSISAHIAQPDRWTYNAAKGAVTQLNRCMAMDMAPAVRVNTVSPGWIWTREVDKAANADGGGREKWGPLWGKFHMLRRLGTVEECAAATAFLLSDEASFITSTEVMVDGGYCGMGSEGLGEASSFAGSE
ncbi:MAG: SDR family oxidoreductase [Kiritimatiellia bacterium]|jgi:NAD(P)-dependent dehydrogenase (short-subunit alcohol dehydrogenase family)|nr:SDR family oxidoreductase [Kiritimatiellia bacterium]